MLEIVANYNCMQFQGELMNQNMAKNLISDLILPHLTQIGNPKFCGFYLYLILGIVASHHCMFSKEN